MSASAYSSFPEWYRKGPYAPYVRSIRSPGGFLSIVDAALPGGDTSDAAVPDLVLHWDLIGGLHVEADLGAGRFEATSKRGEFALAAPDFANSVRIDSFHHVRSVSFPTAKWKDLLQEEPGKEFSFDFGNLHRKMFASPAIRSALRHLWYLCDENGPPSQLLAQAVGCEILAELFRLAGTPLVTTRTGLAPWAERRCVELIRARLSEDISLDDLAAEARLSTFHFSRMFKQSFGVSPRAYVIKMRMETACDLLERTDLSVMDIAQEVGYSSSQVLARVFLKHRRMSPTEYRRYFARLECSGMRRFEANSLQGC